MSVLLMSSLYETRSFWITLPSGFWGWIVIGLIAGWLAGKISRGRGFGCITDIVLGLIGGVVGGWIFTKLHIVSHADSFLYSLAAATVGAIIIVAIAHLFSSGT